MSVKSNLLAFLGALLLITPSCDSPDSASADDAKKKPVAAHHSTATLEIQDARFLIINIPQKTEENFIQTQIAIISANSVIEKAATESAIDAKVIRDALWIEPIKDTNLIELSAYHDDAATATRIAEAVVSAYISHLSSLNRQQAEDSLKALDDELALQGDLVQEHRKKLTVLIQQYGFPYSEVLSTSPIGTTEEEIYRKAQTKLDDLQEQRENLSLQIQKLLKGDDDDMVREAAGIDIPENMVTAYFSTYREACDRLASLQAEGLGPEHTNVQSMEQRAESSLEYAKAEVKTLKKVLETKLRLIDRQIEAMENMISSNMNSRHLPSKLHNYTRAKEDYEQSREVYREMKVKQQEARILLKRPLTPVIIHGWSHN